MKNKDIDITNYNIAYNFLTNKFYVVVQDENHFEVIKNGTLCKENTQNYFIPMFTYTSKSNNNLCNSAFEAAILKTNAQEEINFEFSAINKRELNLLKKNLTPQTFVDKAQNIITSIYSQNKNLTQQEKQNLTVLLDGNCLSKKQYIPLESIIKHSNLNESQPELSI